VKRKNFLYNVKSLDNFNYQIQSLSMSEEKHPITDWIGQSIEKNWSKSIEIASEE